MARRRQIEYPRGFAQVNVTGATVTLSGSKGINGVQRTDNNVYCFDLTFAPRVAVASANINNNATVGTVLGGGVPCLSGRLQGRRGQDLRGKRRDLDAQERHQLRDRV